MEYFCDLNYVFGPVNAFKLKAEILFYW